MNLTWIPQIFMDVLGRIVPGALVIMAGVIVVTGFEHSADVLLGRDGSALSFQALVVFALFSYFVGFTLGQVWNMTVGRFIAHRLETIQAECKEKCLLAHNKALVALGKEPLSLEATQLPSAFVLHDHLRLAAPDQASRLLKLRSECRLCHVIILGFSALAVLNLAYINFSSMTAGIVVEAVLLFSVVSCWSRQLRLEHYFTNGVFLVWFALASKNQFLPGSADLAKTHGTHRDIA